MTQIRTTLLVADGNPFVLELVRRHLQSLGFAVESGDRPRSLRIQCSATAEPDALVDGAIRVLPTAQLVYLDDVPVRLTVREFALLVFLMRHRGQVFTRPELLRLVWGWEVGDLSTVTVHVKRLRAKLGEHHRIDTAWGRGYGWARGAATEQAG